MDPFDEFEPYVRQRLADDPHLWGTALFDEAKVEFPPWAGHSVYAAV